MRDNKPRRNAPEDAQQLGGDDTAEHESELDTAVVEENAEMLKTDPRLASMIAYMQIPSAEAVSASVRKSEPRRRSAIDAEDAEAEYEKSGARFSASDNPAADAADPGPLPVKKLDGSVVWHTQTEHAAGEQQSNTAAELNDDAETSHAAETVTAKQSTADTIGGKKQRRKLQKEQSKVQKTLDVQKAKDGDARIGHSGTGTETTEGRSPQAHEHSTAAHDALNEIENEHKRHQEAKIKIGTLSESIMASPYDYAHHLKSLLSLCTDRNVAVARMARLSLYVVLKDIAPGYTIRLPPKEHELNETLSKPVQRARDFERQMLSTYKAFLSHLQKVCGSIKINCVNDHRVEKDAVQAVQCLCGFARALSHFNCRTDILRFLVPRLAVVSSVIGDEVATALSDVVGNDRHGDAALDTVQLIAQLVRQHRCDLHPRTLQPLGAVPLDSTLLLKKRHEEAKEEKQHEDGLNVSRKQRYKQRKAERAQARKERTVLRQKRKDGLISKEEREEKELEEQTKRDVQEAQALPDFEKRKRLQTLTLEAMFEIYFRVFKHACSMETSDHQSLNASAREDSSCQPTPLLDGALSGTAQRVHFISVDYMGDLMASLRKLMQHALLSKLMRAKCLQSANAILSGEGSALNIDPHEFHKQLFELLDEPLNPGDEGCTLLSLVHDMIARNRSVSSARVAAFAKRLCTTALHCEEGMATGALACVRQLLTKSSSVRVLLENDEATGSNISGGYKPSATDPDYANARDTCAWELGLLQKCPQNDLARAAADAASLPIDEAPPAAPNGSRRPNDVARIHDTSGGDIPAIDDLAAKISDNQKQQPLIHRLLRRGKTPDPSLLDHTTDVASV